MNYYSASDRDPIVGDGRQDGRTDGQGETNTPPNN